MKIAVIGSGSWGSAITSLLSTKGFEVFLWSWQKEETDRLKKDRENKEFLPGIKLDGDITFSNDMGVCVKDAALIVLSTPSHAVRNIAKELAKHIAPGQIVLNIAKGLETSTLKRLSEVIKDEIPNVRLGVMVRMFRVSGFRCIADRSSGKAPCCCRIQQSSGDL